MKVQFKIATVIGMLHLMVIASISSSFTVVPGPTINYTVEKSIITASKNNESISYSGFQLGDIHFNNGTEFEISISNDFSFGVNYYLVCGEVVCREYTLSDNCLINLLHTLNTGNRIASELFLNWEYFEKFYERGLLLEIFPIIITENSIMEELITVRDQYPIHFSTNFQNRSPIVNAHIQEKKGNIIGEWHIEAEYYFQQEYLYQITMSEKQVFQDSTGTLMGYWRQGIATRNIGNESYVVEYEFKVERYGYELEGFEIGLYTTNSAPAMILFVIMIPFIPISIVSKLKRKRDA